MQIARVTKIIVAVLVLTFVGQSIASTGVSCMDGMLDCQKMMKDSTKCMDMTASESSNACADCTCSPISCGAVLLSTFQVTFEPALTVLPRQYTRSIENRLLTSLYRPPITR